MVVGAFPVAKLGTLLLKQISKPIANIVKSRAKQSYFFRTYICMPPAQFYNWCEVKSKMWILNLGKPAHVPKLNENMAIELGANLLGEGIIFVIAAGALLFEYNRGNRKEKEKEEKRNHEIATLNYTIQELYFQAERQDAQIRELMRVLYDLEGQVKKSSLTGIFGKKPPSDGGGKPEQTTHETVPSQGSHGYPSGILAEAIEYLQKDVKRKR